MYSVGIIPAAGKATRFGGVLKELLPIPAGTPLQAAATRLRVEIVVVVSTPEKIGEHSRILPGAIYVMQTEGHDIWGAMLAGMRIEAERYYFTMPDTIMPVNAFEKDPSGWNFTLGTFETNTPERFGCVENGMVVNKSLSISPPATAWGVLVWSRNVRDYWLSAYIETYTDAINQAMTKFGYGVFDLEYYYDLATLEDYKEYLDAEI